MRTHDIFEFVCLCGQVVQSEERLTTCPKCGRVIQLDWGEHATPCSASWHAALYALILRSRGIDRDEIPSRVYARYRQKAVRAQLEAMRSERYVFPA
jgi:hypothetical protein